MESFGAFLDEEWESLSKLFSNEDSDNIFTNFNSGNSFSNNSEVPSNFLQANGDQNNMYGVDTDQSLFFPSDNSTFDHTYNFYCNTISQESSNSNSALFTNQSNGVNNILHDHVTNNTFESIDYYNMDSKNNVPNLTTDDLMEEILQLKSELCNDQFSNIAETNNDSCKEMQLKRKSTDEDIINSPDQNPKKKPRVSKDAQKNKRTYTRSKKNKKDVQISSNDEENNTEGNSITCSSEDDSNIASSQELNGSESKDSISLNSKGKAKASRGSATDPQSLYARRRRERINERLKILQNLVPNGTKVDISTMLEEAVHYVKFLQLQIKLLSSDEMWMYAPIAYNGMDMGLYQKLFL